MLDDFIKEPFLGFDPKAPEFLGKLKNKKYNNKKWFDAHRDIYEEYLKAPMRQLIDTLSVELKKVDPDIVISYKSIFRINRDIRFKNDKTPYKTNYSAAFTYDRIKTPEIPQFYFHIAQGEFLFAAGQYSSDTNIIKKIRRNIYENPEDFLEIAADKKLLRYFGEVQGDSLKKLPKEFNNESIDDDLGKYLRMKQFYVFKTYNEDITFNPELAEIIVNDALITNKFNKFLYKSVF
ncbi:MAG: DUF2461 domain-containing protein [Ignavibacteria bacterium]|nr:DUF2461 domain-containing protein [Ignavibacteria bacterium]